MSDEAAFLEDAIAYSIANYCDGGCVTKCEYLMAQEIVRWRRAANV